jgi:hypothetical protein
MLLQRSSEWKRIAGRYLSLKHTPMEIFFPLVPVFVALFSVSPLYSQVELVADPDDSDFT